MCAQASVCLCVVGALIGGQRVWVCLCTVAGDGDGNVTGNYSIGAAGNRWGLVAQFVVCGWQQVRPNQ